MLFQNELKCKKMDELFKFIWRELLFKQRFSTAAALRCTDCEHWADKPPKMGVGKHTERCSQCPSRTCAVTVIVKMDLF